MILASLIPDSREAAGYNTAACTKAFCADVPATIELKAGHRYFLKGAFRTKPVVGCGRFVTDAAGGYPIKPTPMYDGALARIEQVGTGPIGLLSGAGFVVDDPIEFVGDGVSPIFEVEGRANPASGRHLFRQARFANAGFACDFLPGYYADKRDFIDDENHADNCLFDWCEFMDCQPLRLRNCQSVNHVVRDCMFGQTGPDRPFTFAEIYRGGILTFERPRLCVTQITGVRLIDPDGKNYSPNNCHVIISDMKIDRPANAGGPSDKSYFRPVEYIGDSAAVDYSRWILRINGFAPFRPNIIDDANPRLPRDYWSVHLETIYTN